MRSRWTVVIAVVISLLLHSVLFLVLRHSPITSATTVAPVLEVRSIVITTSDQQEESHPTLPVSRTATAAVDHNFMPSPERPSVEVRMPILPPACESVSISDPKSAIEPIKEDNQVSRQTMVEARLRDGVTIQADYPHGARRRGEEGTVLLRLEIDENGKVTSATVVSSPGFKDLEASAVKAALQARFKPAESDAGRPVASSVLLPLTFRLK